MTWLLFCTFACTPELLPGVLGADGSSLEDGDQDGHLSDVDCDDDEAGVHPGADEVCDEVDQDCDQAIDEGVLVESWPDQDGDGWGSEGASLSACEALANSTDRGGDCNDEDPSIHPGAVEACNLEDEDCDEAVDEDSDFDGDIHYLDEDADGYGDTEGAQRSCEAPEGTVLEDGDCDDTDDSIFPGATEVWYDGVDSDCDDQDDFDADGDGYDISMDCDDENPSVSPRATEVCGDGIDNDCDGAAKNCALSGDFPLTASAAWFPGVSDEDGAGTEVCGPGDMDGDGRDDLVIGAPGSDEAGTDAGSVHLFLTPVTGTHPLDESSVSWLGPSPDAAVGGELAPMGDPDGDGRVSLIVGGAGIDTTWIVDWGKDSSVSLASTFQAELVGSTGSLAGTAVAGGGDHDGDGLADLWIGAPLREQDGMPTGAVYQVLGPISGLVDLETQARRILAGESSYDSAGSALAVLGDVDGDGLADLVVGAPEDDTENTDGGTAYLVLGGSDHAGLISAHSRLRGTTTTALMGAAVCGPGDLDGDGLSDLVVGAPGADEGENNNGAAYVYLGTVEGDLEDTDAWATLYGEDGGDRAGDALAGPGDFNGDGSADLVIGAQRQGGVLAYAGAAYVVLGPVTGKMGLGSAHARLQGQSAYAFSGAAVAPAGDPDWDGRQDLLVGAPGQETSGTAGGGAWLVLASGM